MIKCCDYIKLLSLTPRVNSLIVRSFIGLSSHSRRTRIVFHWWKQPARGTLTRQKYQPIKRFLDYNSATVLISCIHYTCAEQIPEVVVVFFSSFSQRIELRALEIITIWYYLGTAFLIMISARTEFNGRIVCFTALDVRVLDYVEE